MRLNNFYTMCFSFAFEITEKIVSVDAHFFNKTARIEFISFILILSFIARSMNLVSSSIVYTPSAIAIAHIVSNTNFFVHCLIQI